MHNAYIQYYLIYLMQNIIFWSVFILIIVVNGEFPSIQEGCPPLTFDDCERYIADIAEIKKSLKIKKGP